MASQPNSLDQERKSQTNRGAWLVELPSVEILEMRGLDGLDLLQRISTNDLTKMEVGSWAQTVLTNAKGRMIDLLWVGRIQKDLLYLASGAKNPHKSKEWIEKFIIMEDVHIFPSMEMYEHLVLVGEIDLPGDGLYMQFEEQRSRTRFRHVLVKGSAFQLLLDVTYKLGIQRRSADEFEDYRISEGVPIVGHEITDEFNPLEAGLERLVSWTKGCYVGQEVLARLDTYKKVQRRLVRLALSGGVVSLPVRIVGSAGEVGTLTSITNRSPFIGLGYVAVGQVKGKEAMFVEMGGEQIQVELKD